MHDFPALSSQPQELDTLGSLSASLCFYIDCTFGVYINSVRFDVSPKGTFSNASLWCNRTLESQLTSGISAIALPSDLFLICGEHVWKGIPGKAVGRPCTIGQLTLIHLNRTALIVAAQRRVRRSTQALNEKCDPMVTFWNTAERISASLVPAIGTAHALASLNKLGCWLAKEANATSVALSTMLMDIKSVEHATLQNRAAIEFWLLAQGHGCEDFDGMCCMNLSDHSESIHKSISNLKQLIKQLQQHNEGD